MIMTAGRMVYWKNQLQNSMQQRKEKQDMNTAIGTIMTLNYMQEPESMPFSWRNIKVEVTKTITQHADYVARKNKI